MTNPIDCDNVVPYQVDVTHEREDVKGLCSKRRYDNKFAKERTISRIVDQKQQRYAVTGACCSDMTWHDNTSTSTSAEIKQQTIDLTMSLSPSASMAISKAGEKWPMMAVK